ncbi:hypothetical protein GO986_18625 [Deinococcus sp. HMF7620]|uniref:Uncharacterized protein n=1 Tax=Deinococcus arboris TaxID=2682977 RepID=A0A7C9LPD3_9DEIO|nr:hypothetical protein [Deinococcus arboris]MVN88757.1 hypothetical protein [Deinococcus arboris]
MPALHPAKQKAQVRQLFAEHRVLTTVALERRGLLQAAEWLDLPRIDLHVRTQAHQASSIKPLTFVSADERWLVQPPRDILHHALLAEGAHQLRGVIAAHELQWQYLDLKGRSGFWPDAQLVSPKGREHDASVEVDTGYSPKRCDAKLVAAAAGGYRSLIWLTSVHGRVTKIHARARQLHAAGKLGEVTKVYVGYINVHTPGSPYQPRPRLHKVSALVADFGS